MLIVIVIIGILAAALIPRLSSARGRANDVARKADLAQVAAALVSYQIDAGQFPIIAWPLSLTGIGDKLMGAGMSSIPEDPTSNRAFSWISNINIIGGQFGYTPISKWWIPANGFVLMAGTETEGWSNWVASSSYWRIPTDYTSFESIHICKTFTQVSSANPVNHLNGECDYNKNNDQLRYIYLY